MNERRENVSVHTASQEGEGGSYSIKFNNPLKKGKRWQELEEEKKGKKPVFTSMIIRRSKERQTNMYVAEFSFCMIKSSEDGTYDIDTFAFLDCVK